MYKATGPDNISARFLKESSYNSNPNDCKEASIAPVFKKGNQN